ncbi:MAG: peptidylprolyl isomerase [Oscillospiraceae bacterium]
MIQIQNNTSTEETTKLTSKRSLKNKKFLAGITACAIAIGCLGALTGCSKDTGDSGENSVADGGASSVSDDGSSTVEIDPAKAGLAAYSPNYDVTPQMFACYYQDMIAMFRNMYGDDTLLSYYQMDTSKPLKDQPYPTNDGTTWFDNIVDEAGNTLTKHLVLAEAAKAAGYEMSDEEKKTVDEKVEAAELDIYGNSVSADDVRKAVELQTYSTSYYNSYMDKLDITDDDIQKYVDDNKKEFETCGLIGFAITYKLDNQETDETDETDSEEEDNLLTKDEAKELADKLKNAEDTDEFTETILSYLVKYEGYKEDDLPSAEASIKNDSFPYTEGNKMAEWAFGGEAEVNDVLVLEDSDEENNIGYYYTYMLSREPSIDDTKTVNVRHILFNINAHMDEDDPDEDEAFKECKKLAEETLEEWENGDATEDSFAKLAEEKTEDPGSIATGGLYENVAVGQMVQPFNDWIFDSSRKTGDTEIIKTSYGYHIMYYVSDGDPEWKTQAQMAVTADKYNTWFDEQAELYPVTLNDEVMKSIDG